MNKKYSAINNETGEIEEIENLFKEHIKENSLRIYKKNESVEKIMERLKSNPNSLSLQQIQKLAKSLGFPIDSMNSFYMVSLAPCFLDLELTASTNKILSDLLKLLSNGSRVERYRNKKHIKSMEDFYLNLDISRATFYRAKKELEDKRLVKMYESDERFLVFFNPVYIRCGKMDNAVFTEFEEEIKKVNYLEWLFFKRKFNLSNSLSLNKKTDIIYKDKLDTKLLQDNEIKC